MIELENVRYKYPRGAEVIRGLSCSFAHGELVALTGANGCGKTTLTKLIVGILRPDSGRICIDGVDTAGLDLFELGQRVGYVFQDPARQLFCDTVEHEIGYGLQNLGCTPEEVSARTDEALRRFRLEHRRDAYPGKLSQGEKQRVMLAAILAMGTKYLVLDEPTTGLDIAGRLALGETLEELAKQGCGVLVVSHERRFVERFCTREQVVG